MPRLVLASASPRRAELLRSAGLEFSVEPVDCDERWIPGEHPVAYAERLARAKAELARAADAIILAADTTVWIAPDAPPLGKPSDRREAARALRALSAASPHRVTSAFAILDRRRPTAAIHVAHSTTEVWMRPLSERDLEAFLDTDEWRDKAGGYGIQGRAAAFVRRIAGSYTAVVGLPLAELLEALHGLEP
ncbi:MAG: septum formation protein Maf [Nannocystis sp.]|nr:septum formation protein Maf [Nannocystis sp.]